MNTTQCFYIYKLKEVLGERQKLNANYSLRAFARDLNIHPATLCQVLKNTRELPLKNAHEVAEKLKLTSVEKTYFLESLYRTKTGLDNIKVDPIDDRYMVDLSHEKVIAEWEHFVVINLFDLDGFICSAEEVAKRLGISLHRAEVVIENLLKSGLLALQDGEIVRTQANLRTTEDIQNRALRDSHLENLELGKKKLDEIAVMYRDFSAMTVAVDLKKITEAKTIIREFRQKMAALLRDGQKTDIYQMAIQFYPLTQLEQHENNNTYLN